MHLVAAHSGHNNLLVARFELRSLVGATGCVPFRIRVRAGACKSATRNDLILRALRVSVEHALENLTNTRRVSSLRRERCARDVGGHGMVWHRTPGVVLRGWLRKPDITSISGQAPVAECCGNS